MALHGSPWLPGVVRGLRGGARRAQPAAAAAARAAGSGGALRHAAARVSPTGAADVAWMGRWNIYSGRCYYEYVETWDEIWDDILIYILMGCSGDRSWEA